MSTDTRPSLGRHIGRVSVEISDDCRSTYRPIVSDTVDRSTDALSTHDPIAVRCSVSLPFCCFTRVYEGHFMLCYKEEFLVELSR